MPGMASEAPRRPRFSASGATFAAVLVGLEEKPFVVHEALLTHYSEFFRAALTGRFKEAEEKTVKLPTEDPKIFEFFQFWMYHGRFPSEKENDDDNLTKLWMDVQPDDDPSPSDNLIRMCVFGDQYQVPGLYRYALDTFFDHMEEDENSQLPASKATTLAFNALPRSSPMRRLLVDLYCRYARWEDKDAIVFQDSGPFLVAVLQRWTQAHHHDGDCDTQNLELCDYHDHENEDEKKACQAERKKKRKRTSG